MVIDAYMPSPITSLDAARSSCSHSVRHWHATSEFSR